MPTILIALVTFALLVKVKELQEPLSIVVAGSVGVSLKALLPH